MLAEALLNTFLRVALFFVLLAGLAFAVSLGEASATGATVTPALFNATISPGESESFAITVATGSSPVPALDVVFAIDRTASMDDEIEVVKLKSIEIMNGIRERIPDSAFGAVTFADYPGYFPYPDYENDYGQSTDSAYDVNANITKDISAVSSAIEGISIGDGGDSPEDYTRVLFEVMSAQWRPLTKKVVILFGDAATHDTNFAGYNYGGDPGRDAVALTSDDLDFETVVSQLRDSEHISILAVQGSTDDPNPAPATATFKGMSTGFEGALGTNGQYYLLDKADEIPAAIDQVLSQEVSTIDALTLDIPADYHSWVAFDPASYEAVGPDSNKTFNVTITVPQGTPAGGQSFLIRALGDGGLLGSTSVEITVPPETIGADLGFKPDQDGFRFDNYGASTPDLTWDMFEQFFGRDVVRHSNGDHVYAAEQWFGRPGYSSSGVGGHCDGFSAASLLNWAQVSQPNAGQFAMPVHKGLYSVASDDAIRNAIAYQQGYWSSYEIMAQDAADFGESKGSPRYYYEKVKQQIQNHSPVILSLWKEGTKGKRGVGHSLVPYRFEESGDTANLYVYDNNHHGDSGRRIEFNLKTDTWSYVIENLWILPTETWRGDSSYPSLTVIPLSMRIHNGVPAWNPGTTDGPAAFVGVNGPAVLKPDAPDAFRIVPPLSNEEGPLPFDLYYVNGEDYGATILGGEEAGPVKFSAYTGSRPASTAADGRTGALVQLDTTASGSTADMVLVTPDGLSMNYTSNEPAKTYSAAVDLELSDTSRVATVGDTTIAHNETATVQMTPAGVFRYVNEGAAKEYNLSLTQYGAGAGSFRQDGLAIGANETQLIEPTDWNALGSAPVIVEIDEGNDGTIDRKMTLLPGSGSGGTGGGSPLLVGLFALVGGALTAGFLGLTLNRRRVAGWVAVLPDGRTVALRYGDNLVGRGTRNRIRLDTQLVSRHHALIRVEREQVTVHDLQSANGTFVNGRQVSTARLDNGDEIRLGGIRMLIRFLKRHRPASGAGKGDNA
jgi:hypothetical protein